MKIERRGQRWQSQTRSPPFAVDKLDFKVRLNADALLRADLAEKRERLVVAAQHHMLAVVHPLARLRIVEGRRPPAEHGLSLEHSNAGAARRKGNRSAEPGHASANHNDVWCFHVSRSITFSHVVAAISA